KKCSEPKYELYQNVNGLAEKNVERIKKNIVEQLVKPVLWKQMMKNIKKMKWKNLLILVKEEC
ncbi:MAG: hypothetical protein LBD32_00795, partial [Cytophagales bacterium]|nr:hypothetical protein [Cytophagales bacterium]